MTTYKGEKKKNLGPGTPAVETRWFKSPLLPTRLAHNELRSKSFARVRRHQGKRSRAVRLAEQTHLGFLRGER